MDVVPSNYMPGDPRLIDQIVYELKSQGIFDQFRKECIADVDTKPAYQNLRQRVEGNVTSFLAKQKWSEDLNKNQLREQLRKHISEAGWLEKGVERIVDQVVNPKINTVFLPKVEDVYHSFLGIEKPLKIEDMKAENPEKVVDQNEAGTSSKSDSIPKDMEAISPESTKDNNPNNSDEMSSEPINIDEKSQGSSSTTLRTEDEESPPFEPLDEVSESSSKFSPKDECSVDSQASGPMSNDLSIEQKPSTPVDISQEISQNSSDTMISSSEIEICQNEEECSIKKSNNESSENEKSKLAEHLEKPEKQMKLKCDKKESEDEKPSEKEKDKKSKHDKDQTDEKISRESSHSKERSSSKHSHKSSRDKESKRDDKDKKEHRKEESKPRENSSKDKDHGRDKDKSKDRSHREKDSKSGKEKSDKDKDKREDKDKHKSTSSRERDSKRMKDKEKTIDNMEKSNNRRDEKHKLPKETSSKESSNENKESSKKHSSDRSRDKDKESSSSRNKHSREDKNKEKSRHHSKDSKFSNDHHKDKNGGDAKSKSSDKHKKIEPEKKSSSSKKEKDKKSEDDHYSSKKKRSERRSTDRDSNDGSGKMSRNSSFTENNSQSSKVNKSSSRKLFDSSSSGDSSGGNSDNVDGPGEYIEESELVEHELVEHEFVLHSEIVENAVIEHPEEIVGEVEIVHEPQFGRESDEVVPMPTTVEVAPSIQYIKPKFASNMNEALRIMKIRKQLAELEKQANSTLQNLSGNNKNIEDKEKESPKDVDVENTEKAIISSAVDIEATPAPSIKFIKPKFASNIQEAMRLMKIRKKLAKLEKEHQQALAELRKRKETSIISTVVEDVAVTSGSNDQPSVIIPVSLSTADEVEELSKIGLPVDEPLLQSFDLSSERFAELEARLALEMANIDFSSYDIPSDEDEEYQSIVISPKKNKSKPKQETATIKDNSNADKKTPGKKLIRAEKLLNKKHVVKVEAASRKPSKLQTKDDKKIVKSKIKAPKSTKKNKILNDTSLIKKAKDKIAKKKLIIISCKQNLFNGFAEEKAIVPEKAEVVPDSPMFEGFENGSTTNYKGTSSSEKENSETISVYDKNIQEAKKNLSKVLFIQISESDQHEVRRASMDISEHVQSTLTTDESSERIDGQNECSENIIKDSANVEKVNELENIKESCVGEDIDLWESEETPCFYFLPPTKDSEKHLNHLNDFIDQLERRIEKHPLITDQSNDVPKKKVGRKRKNDPTNNMLEMNLNSPDVKRKRRNSVEDKYVNNLVLNDEGQNLGFSLPLSPAESEVDMKKDEPLIVPTKRRSDRASVNKRYDNSDLYKPRPVISRGSSRRSMAMNADKP